MKSIIATTLRAPETLITQLKEKAVKHGHTLNGLILQILWDWIKQNEIG